MTVALYCRVSTEEQALQGFSLEAQKDRLIAYCQSQGWSDYQVYSDDGYTGTNMERPALKQLIRHIERGVVESVVVYRLDRLSRRQSHCLHLLEEVFDTHNVTFRSATEPFDTSTPLGKAMLGILAVFAQLERETIIERTKEGHHKRARKGLWGGGPQPFGYRWNKEEERLEIEPQEAQIVAGIYRRYLAGEPLNAIADWAAERSGEKWWDHSVVKNIIKRDIYTGVIQYGTERAQGHHEPIIDFETAQRARDELKRRNSGKRAIGQYLLSGLLRCGECGEPIVHHRVRNHHYYVCARKQQGQHYFKPGPSCSSHHFGMNILDDAVTRAVHEMATDPSVLLTRIDDRVDASKEAQLTALKQELTGIEKKLKRWYDAFEEGNIDTKILRTRIGELERDRTRLELLIDETQDELESTSDPSPVIDALHAIRDAWDDMENEERKSVLRAAIQRIRVYKDAHFDIEWNL